MLRLAAGVRRRLRLIARRFDFGDPSRATVDQQTMIGKGESPNNNGVKHQMF